jgi:hypothetical protein
MNGPNALHAFPAPHLQLLLGRLPLLLPVVRGKDAHYTPERDEEDGAMALVAARQVRHHLCVCGQSGRVCVWGGGGRPFRSIKCPPPLGLAGRSLLPSVGPRRLIDSADPIAGRSIGPFPVPPPPNCHIHTLLCAYLALSRRVLDDGRPCPSQAKDSSRGGGAG